MNLLKQYIHDQNVIDYIIKPLLEPKKLSDYDIGWYGLGYLLSTVKDYNACMYGSCCSGYLEIVKLMIEKGADNLRDGFYIACKKGHLEIVKLMIENGADNWDNGLSSACQSGHLEIVKIMVEKGANSCLYCRRSIQEHLA